jgi:hypothetical protein
MPRWALHLAVDAGADQPFAQRLPELLASQLEFLSPRITAGVVPLLELTVAAAAPADAVAYAEERVQQIFAAAGIVGVHCELVDISPAQADQEAD